MLTSKLQETGECYYLAHPTDMNMFFCGYDETGAALFTPLIGTEGVEPFEELETANAFCYFIHQGTPLRVVQCVYSQEMTFIWRGIDDEDNI